MKHNPPIGVIAPMDRTPVSASVYKLPEKISTPADSSQQTEDAPFTGTWRPAQPLSVFQGTAGDGNWKFTVADLASGDVGHVRKLSIHLNRYVTP